MGKRNRERRATKQRQRRSTAQCRREHGQKRYGEPEFPGAGFDGAGFAGGEYGSAKYGGASFDAAGFAGTPRRTGHCRAYRDVPRHRPEGIQRQQCCRLGRRRAAADQAQFDVAAALPGECAPMAAASGR